MNNTLKNVIISSKQFWLLTFSKSDFVNAMIYRRSLIHECSCIIEFIKQAEEKKLKRLLKRI